MTQRSRQGHLNSVRACSDVDRRVDRWSARRMLWTTVVFSAALALSWGARAEARSTKEALSSAGARIVSQSAVGVTGSGKHARHGNRSPSVRVLRHRPYYSAYVGFGYPWWGWGPYYGWGWGAPYGYGRPVDYYGDDWGAIDLDIKPEEAEVYLDGERIGIADNYDGFPRYLWLEKGTYHLVLYKEGYETLAKRIELSEGGVLRLKDKMVPGVAKSPEELYAQVKPEERAPARSAEERPLAPWRYRDRDDGNARTESARPERSERSGEDWRRRRATSTAEPAATDLRSVGGRLELTVTPADAAVYVDGKFVGTAADLVANGEAIRLDAGSHKLQLSRPGYRGVDQEITVKEGETTSLELALEPQ